MRDSRSRKPIRAATETAKPKRVRDTSKIASQRADMTALLKSFGICDQETLACFQRSMQNGGIHTIQDVARFISRRLGRTITPDDVSGMVKQVFESSMPEAASVAVDQASQEAAQLFNLGDDASEEEVSSSSPPERCQMSPPSTESLKQIFNY